MPHFKPEMDPRTFFSPEESIRYNTELRSQPEPSPSSMSPRPGSQIWTCRGRHAAAVRPSSQYFYWLEPDVAVQACRIQHERFAEVIADHPDRFAAVANLPMAYPDIAVEVMDEAKRDFGFNGFEMNGDVNGEDLRRSQASTRSGRRPSSWR